MITIQYKEHFIHIIYLSVVGSKLHGLNTEKSDTDYKGVFFWGNQSEYSIHVPPESIDKNMTSNNDWSKFINEINSEFSLELSSDDDISFFTAREFMKLGLKNDTNIFDMLYADRIIHSDFICHFQDEIFDKIIEYRECFLDQEIVSRRLRGMALNTNNNYLKLYKKENKTSKEINDMFKNQAKSIQALISLMYILREGVYTPILSDNSKKLILDIKTGSMDIEPYLELYKSYDLVVNQILNNESFICANQDKEFINELLINLYEDKNIELQ